MSLVVSCIKRHLYNSSEVLFKRSSIKNAFGGKNEDDEEGGQGGTGGAPPAKVCDVLDSFHYEETGFDKDQFKEYFKGYMKKLKEHLEKNKPDRV